MNTHPFARTASILVGAIVLAAPIETRAATLFTQNFDNISGINAVLNDQVPGWNAYISQKAFDMGLANNIQYNYNNDATPPAPGSLQAYAGSSTSAPAEGPGVFGGYLQNGTANTAGAAGTPIMASVGTGLNIATADYTELSFSWKENTSLAGPTTKLLLQVDGAWYASAADFTPTVGGFAALDTAATQSLSFSPAASSWLQFTLTPGTTTNLSNPANGSMALGSVVSADLTGTITGIGFFTTFATDGAQTTLRIDQLNITGTAIPEPANIAALIGIACLGFTASRRCRKS